MKQTQQMIDAHIHLWDLECLQYGWLTDDYIEDLLPVPYKNICRNYLIEEYLREVKSSNVVGAVHIQAALDHPDPVDETQWLQGRADAARFAMSIVGSADLTSKEVGGVLDRHMEYTRFCGVRMLRVNAEMFADHNFRRGLKCLETRDLVYDLDVQWQSMEAASAMAEAFPNIRFIVNHAGFPIERTIEYQTKWKDAMKQLSRPDNVVCKISGLGMYDPDWSVDSIQPWVEHTLECFGSARCMMASNWPLDSLFSTYDTLIDAYQSILATLSASERNEMFYENAKRIYSVDSQKCSD